MSESDLLLDGHREQCTHTAEWDASCRNVMILSQILSTLERRPSRHHYPPRHRSYSSMRPALTPPVSRAQKLLTHFVNTLQYAPGEHGGAQVFAAINVGNVVSVIEDPVARSNENAQYSSGTSHAYHAVEVKTPRRSANDVVRNEIVPGGLTDHIGDIMVAVGQADEGPAQELVILRSLTWIRRRLNLLRFLKNPNPDSDTGPPFLSVLTSLRPPPDAGTVTIEVRTDVWDLSAQNQTATVTLSTFAVFQELETKVQDVLKYLQKYDLTTTKEARTRAFHPLTVSLMRLHFVARNPVFDGPDFFGSPQMEQIAQDLIHRSIGDDPLDIHDIGDDTRLGMRVLNAIRSITHPIRSMDVLLDSVLPKLIQAGALKIYTIHEGNAAAPQLVVQDLWDFRSQFKMPVPEQDAVDRLILRAFFSKVSLRSLAFGTSVSEARATVLSGIVRDLDDFAERDAQSWGSDDDSVMANGSSMASSSSASTQSEASGNSVGRNASPDPISQENEEGKAGNGVGDDKGDSKIDAKFSAACDALEQLNLLPSCTATRHVECILMTALQEEEVNGRVFAATKRPCFCCDSVRSEFFNHQMSGNHNTVFPWAPPCGLPLTTLKKVELALERKLKSAAKARRLVDATGSGSDASSLVNDAEQVPRRRREWRYDLLG